MSAKTLPRETEGDKEPLISGVSVRFNAAEKVRLQQLANQECRKLSLQIRFIVRQYLENLGPPEVR